jgi:hypothetical protein
MKSTAVNTAKELTRNVIRILAENDTARRLEINIPTAKKSIQTPNYIMSTKG